MRYLTHCLERTRRGMKRGAAVHLEEAQQRRQPAHYQKLSIEHMERGTGKRARLVLPVYWRIPRCCAWMVVTRVCQSFRVAF